MCMNGLFHLSAQVFMSDQSDQIICLDKQVDQAITNHAVIFGSIFVMCFSKVGKADTRLWTTS